MSATVVRYRVRPGHAEDNIEAVAAVYAELAAVAPPGFRYSTVLLEDGVTFVHVAITEGDADAPLTSLPAFQAFRAALGTRAEAPPEVLSATIVGRYP